MLPTFEVSHDENMLQEESIMQNLYSMSVAPLPFDESELSFGQPRIESPSRMIGVVQQTVDNNNVGYRQEILQRHLHTGSAPDYIEQTVLSPDFELDILSTQLVADLNHLEETGKLPGPPPRDPIPHTKRKDKFDRTCREFSSKIGAKRSRRTGPLSAESRAMMAHIRKINSCWRCGILRKKVSLSYRPYFVQQILKNCSVQRRGAMSTVSSKQHI